MLSDTQLLTIALATVPTLIVVAIGILINNHRLTDMKDRMSDIKETLRAEIKAGDSAILSQMAIYQMDIISKIAELDNRITRLVRP
ncbi:MAG TPA: hypothetical protein VGS58_04850 [Candidatus Sulfopaludibacter sp.]|nr:hypothetical protein [Candidatus Sulfopaludibacter sp.]